MYTERIRWTKAASCAGGNCVQVASTGDGLVVLIGDSKNADGPVLSYTRDEWVAFLEGAKNGDFDHLN
jgi:hypothetical protein